MSDVTRILSAIEQGDPRAADQLLPLVYDALRQLAAQKLAQEAPGQTLQPTALVHEAYLSAVGEGRVQHWDGRHYFFAAQPKQGFLSWETTGKKGIAATASDSHPMAYCMVPPEAAPAKKS